jgi:hypothetical protein
MFHLTYSGQSGRHEPNATQPRVALQPVEGRFFRAVPARLAGDFAYARWLSGPRASMGRACQRRSRPVCRHDAFPILST